jgi:hypothetical protein
MDIIGTPEKTGVAALDQVRKSTGAINLNYVGFLKAAKLISQDNRYFLRKRPAIYFYAVVRAYGFYLLPASDAWQFQDLKSRRAGIRILDRLYCLLLLGQLRPFYPAAHLARPGYFPASFLVVGFPVLLVFGFYRGAKASGRKDQATFITIAFLVANILYVTLVTTLFSDADHNRYRFKVDGFYIALLGLLISSWGSKRGSSR